MKEKTFFVDEASLLHPPTVIAEFVKKLTTGISPRRSGVERRSEPRYTLTAIIEAQPVDEQFQATDEVFKAVTRDISVSGIGITHNRTIDTRLLAIQLTNPEGERIQTIVEILRSQQHGGIWEVGGRFVTKD